MSCSDLGGTWFSRSDSSHVSSVAMCAQTIVGLQELELPDLTRGTGACQILERVKQN
jgi:hypothetical protein